MIKSGAWNSALQVCYEIDKAINEKDGQFKWNIYNTQVQCEGKNGQFYDSSAMNEILNDEQIKIMLGVTSDRPWIDCDDKVYYTLNEKDSMKSMDKLIESLLQVYGV